MLAIAATASAEVIPDLGTAGDYAVFGKCGVINFDLSAGGLLVEGDVGVGPPPVPPANIDFTGGGTITGSFYRPWASTNLTVSGGSQILGRANIERDT